MKMTRPVPTEQLVAENLKQGDVVVTKSGTWRVVNVGRNADTGSFVLETDAGTHVSLMSEQEVEVVDRKWMLALVSGTVCCAVCGGYVDESATCVDDYAHDTGYVRCHRCEQNDETLGCGTCNGLGLQKKS